MTVFKELSLWLVKPLSPVAIGLKVSLFDLVLTLKEFPANLVLVTETPDLVPEKGEIKMFEEK